jgi:hypothetical protein
MTQDQFRRFECMLAKQPFQTSISSPLLFGIARAEFQINQLQRLIAAGEGIPNRRIQRRLNSCRSQIERLEATQERLRERHRDVFGNGK